MTHFTPRFFQAGLLALSVLAPHTSWGAPQGETPIQFAAGSDQQTEAFAGTLTVPENRAAEGSRPITLHYVRFPAEAGASGPPIVYLSGGPGGSGISTAKGPRYPLFMALRKFGDVIALDQRGTGDESDLTTCTSDQSVPVDAVISKAEVIAAHRAGLQECLALWSAEGIDLHGYTTAQSVADLDALRQHLGAQKLSLWGISYGTHLALAAMREMGDHLDKVILASVEGTDQTVKLPAQTDAYFDRLQQAIDQHPQLRETYPDVKGLIGGVLQQLERQPLMLEVAFEEGSTHPFLLQKWHMQLISGYMISDPKYALMMLDVYAGILRGDTEILSNMVVPRVFDAQGSVSFYPMSTAMDLASGIGAARQALVSEQAQEALLDDWLNFPMPHLAGAVPDLDLGDGFREAPQSDVPTLVFSGTLDGRTYLPSQKDAVSGLSQMTHVTIQNAGHNLYMSTPEVTRIIERFMRGEEIGATQVEVPLLP